jgi:riboflavin synthase
MFTGIIQGKGKLFELRPAGGGMVFGLEADFPIDHPQEGESIAINGVCLTARNISGRRFLADVSPESLSRTNLGGLATGDSVNLERALRLSDRLGGHLVSGHVDAVGKLLSKKESGDFTIFNFAVPQDLSRYIIEKGSITIDGISLTVNSCSAGVFSVSIIPHTLGVTMLGTLSQGDTVNIEVDLIGKYVESLLGSRKGLSEVKSKINATFLAEHGF